MMITILSKGDINTLTTKIRRLMRNKIGISNTALNIILTHREFYNLIDLYYRQGESQIVNLLKRLNYTCCSNPKLFGIMTAKMYKFILNWQIIFIVHPKLFELCKLI